MNFGNMPSMSATGANSVPLGRPNATMSSVVGGAGAVGAGRAMSSESMLNAAREAAARIAEKRRGFSAPASSTDHTVVGGPGPMKKKRRSRWEQAPTEAAPIVSVPIVLPPNLTPEQEKQFLLHLQIDEQSRRLRTGDLGIPPNPEDRSPSPEPIYNSEGKRLNTREYRTRKKIEEERHKLIQEALVLNPEYKPPADYKPPVQRVSDRVTIPQDKHPDINFVGLLIGPRGNTLKKMEKETGAKIMIRGKGSVKEGKIGRKDGQPLPGEDEPLHALVTANNAESVTKAVDEINEIIKQGIETPEGQNDLRRMQLRELAKLNGTLREDDTIRCTNCGANTHRTWQCPERQNITNTVLCQNCGGTGHIAADCRQKRGTDPGFGSQSSVDKAKMDSEYMSLMAELGEGPPPPPTTSTPLSSGPRPLLSTPVNPPPPLMSQNAQMLPWGHKEKHHGMMDNKPPSLLGSSPSQHPPSLMSQQVPPPPSLPPPPPPSSGGNQPWGQLPPAPPASQAMPLPPPSLLAAPPPPPPTSEPPMMPPHSQWQVQTSSAPTLATHAGAPPWQQPHHHHHQLQGNAPHLMSANLAAPPWHQIPGSPSVTSSVTNALPPPPWQMQAAPPPPWQQPPPPPVPPPQPPNMMPPGMPPPPVQPPLPPGPPPPPPVPMMPYGQPPPPPPPIDASQGMGAVPPLLPPAPPPPPPPN